MFSAGGEVRFSAGVQAPVHFAGAVLAAGSVSGEQTVRRAGSVSGAGDSRTVPIVSAAADAVRRQTGFVGAVSVPVPAGGTGDGAHCWSEDDFPVPDGSAVHSRRGHSVGDAAPEDNRLVHSRSGGMAVADSRFADNHSGGIRSEGNRFVDTHSVLPDAVPFWRSAAVYRTDPWAFRILPHGKTWFLLRLCCLRFCDICPYSDSFPWVSFIQTNSENIFCLFYFIESAPQAP